jgi:hypothetical protein
LYFCGFNSFSFFFRCGCIRNFDSELESEVGMLRLGSGGRLIKESGSR